MSFSVELRALLAGLAVGFAAFAAVTAASPAGAHDYEIYFQENGWVVDPNVQAGNLQATLDGTTSNRAKVTKDVNHARNQWNNVSGSAFDMWQFLGFNASIVWTGDACNTNPNSNRITIVTHNISSLGQAHVCGGGPYPFLGGPITDAVILVDHRAWKKGGGTPAANQYDLRSLLVHEIGHAAGFGQYNPVATHHFPSGTTTCPSPLNSTANTMCSGLGTGSSYTGKRTLESHDEHTIAGFY